MPSNELFSILELIRCFIDDLADLPSRYFEQFFAAGDEISEGYVEDEEPEKENGYGYHLGEQSVGVRYVSPSQEERTGFSRRR